MDRLPLVYHEDYVTPLPEGHRFPMAKFGLLRDWLVTSSTAGAEQFVTPDPAPLDRLHRVHTAGYVEAILHGGLDPKAERRIGLPWSPGLARRTRTAVGGTIRTCELALKWGLASHCAGGTHHAFADFGAGFCLFNDIAVAARTMVEDFGVKQVLVVDLDVHQGDGTAAIFREDPAVFTFSTHCGKNFPLKKQTSDLDIDLPPGTDDAAYLRTLVDVLPGLVERVQPDLVIYDAGVDVHRDDRLGYLELTDTGVYDRDYFVIETCRSAGVPVATVIGGGYHMTRDDRLDMAALARRHGTVHRAATDFVENRKTGKQESGKSEELPRGV